MNFSDQIRKKVYKTIEEYELISPKDKLIVAVSGGKDSMSLMHLLKDKFDMTALFIDVIILYFVDLFLSRKK
jgi:tRNA(Ile)-lysidine synthase TilS/MesJ